MSSVILLNVNSVDIIKNYVIKMLIVYKMFEREIFVMYFLFL